MNTAKATTSKGRAARIGMVAAALGFVFVLGTSQDAAAYVGETRSIPSYNGAYGSATLTSFHVYGTAKATVYLHRGSNKYCVYVQAAPYLVLGLDGGWKEVSGSRTCSSSTSYYSDSMFLGYDGLKFRICQAIPYHTDSCGSNAYIHD